VVTVSKSTVAPNPDNISLIVFFKFCNPPVASMPCNFALFNISNPVLTVLKAPRAFSP
jgi:hypothetical protein